MIKYYDIGLNLFCKQFREPEKIISDAEADGVSCILTGSDMKSSESVNKFVKTHSCYGTCGIHPHSADSAKAEDFKRIREIVSGNEKIVAVGECGLDYDRMFSTRENQIRCFEHHIKIAEELGKPLMICNVKVCYFSGRVNIKAVPFPTSLSAHILPPWDSIMNLQMNRPRPVPVSECFPL